MDFAGFLKKQAQIINIRLEEVLAETSKKVEEASPELNKLFDEFIESSRGGKRIRGGLVLLGYQIGGGENSGSRIEYGTTAGILDAAVAFEIFQTSILAQDDVIDKSLLRRGKPSLYKALGGDDRAIAQSLCLSDLGFFTGYRLLSALKIEDSLKIKAINLYSQTLIQTVLGEMLDVETPFLQRDFLNEDALKIALLKTARYTISGPLMLGAILAGANPKKLKELQIFGDNLGIAFQIQDDIFGVFGDAQIIGKSGDSDIKECKATLLIAHAQKKGNAEQREVLEKYYGNSEVDEEGVKEVKRVFEETGALDFAKACAEKYFLKAERSLEGLEEPLLFSLVEFLRKRSA